MKGIRRKPEDNGPNPFETRQLKSGRWVGCRHLTADGKVIGFNAAKAHKSKDPAQGFVAHDH